MLRVYKFKIILNLEKGRVKTKPISIKTILGYINRYMWDYLWYSFFTWAVVIAVKPQPFLDPTMDYTWLFNRMGWITQLFIFAFITSFVFTNSQIQKLLGLDKSETFQKIKRYIIWK